VAPGEKVTSGQRIQPLWKTASQILKTGQQGELQNSEKLTAIEARENQRAGLPRGIPRGAHLFE